MSGGGFASAVATGHPPANMRDYRLEVQTVRLMSDGFVVTLAVRGTSKDGLSAEVHVCQIMTVEDDPYYPHGGVSRPASAQRPSTVEPPWISVSADQILREASGYCVPIGHPIRSDPGDDESEVRVAVEDAANHQLPHRPGRGGIYSDR
jgi:hypothetical protein